MTMTADTTTADIALAGLLAAGCQVTYKPDTVWDGYVYADLRDAAGRLIECGCGAGQDQALADLERRLARPETAERAAAMVATTAPQEALLELADENADLRDELAESHRSVTLCIRVLGDLITEAYPDGVTAAAELKGRLRKLLDAGHRVGFSKDPDGYVATIGDHDAIAESPAAALAAVVAAAGQN